jgi:hypothetical protein
MASIDKPLRLSSELAETLAIEDLEKSKAAWSDPRQPWSRPFNYSHCNWNGFGR